VKIYTLSNQAGKNITHFDSDFVLTRLVQTDGPVHMNVMNLEENGIIGYHEAAVPQLLMIIEGEGWVRTATDEKTLVKKGDLVFWKKGEWHETSTKEGLTAIVIEGPMLALVDDLIEKYPE